MDHNTDTSQRDEIVGRTDDVLQPQIIHAVAQYRWPPSLLVAGVKRLEKANCIVFHACPFGVLHSTVSFMG